MTCVVVLAPVFAAVQYAAYWLRLEGRVGEAELRMISHSIVWIVGVKLAVFGWFRVYQGWSRFVTFHDLVVLAQAATTSSVLLALGHYLALPSLTAPRSILLLDWGLTIFVVGALRSVSRAIEERRLPTWISCKGTPVFIVGANNSGEALLRAIRRNQQLPYRVAGFIAEDESSLASWIGGVPVIGLLEDTCKLAQKHGVAQVFIASGELSGQQVRKLVEDGRRCGVEVKVLPSYEELLRGSVDLRPRTVSISDVLRREPVELNLHDLHHWIDGRALLVTGSAGSIGSEICRQLLQFQPKRLVLVDRVENGQFFLERELLAMAPKCEIDVRLADINDFMRMNSLFRAHRPDIVFHAAAYKHVPLMEENAGEAVKNIALATRLLADLADRHGVGSFVMISSDKAVNPSSVMGACKRVAELYVQALAERSDCRFVTVRFGNVLDSSGSVVPIFREQIASGGPVTVTHPDVERYFMTIPEASQLVIQAGAMGKGGEIFVLDMGHPIRIVDLAEDMIRLSGLQAGKDIEIQFVGLRPGEKLFEELHVPGEKRIATSHPKISVAVSAPSDWAAVRAALERISRITEGPRDAVVAELSRIVHEYRRQQQPAAALSRKAA